MSAVTKKEEIIFEPALDEVQDRNQLSRTLSVWDLMFYGLAATLGTGIFVTVGQVSFIFPHASEIQATGDTITHSSRSS